MGFIGRELALSNQYSYLERFYIRCLGVPIVGLRIRARNVFSLINPQKKYRRILDIGTGTGVFSFELARWFPHARIMGIDILESEIKNARKVAWTAGFKNIEFAQWDIADQCLDNGYDLAMCIDILEHVQDDSLALNNIYKSLDRHGTFILHVPALYRRYPVFRKQLNFDVPTHVRIGYELEEIQEKVRSAGFFIEKSGYTYGFMETLANNISYMITGAKMKNKHIYALAFPFLNLIAKIGAKAKPNKFGAGIFVVAIKTGVERK